MEKIAELRYWQRRNERTSRVANVIFLAAVVTAIAIMGSLVLVKLQQAVSFAPTVLSLLFGA